MSRFVPAGTAPEDAPPPPPVDDEWAAARREVKSKEAPKQPQNTQIESKSLYETLEANKAAKQAEFEDASRLKNQFKALDEDDVDFLDSVLETERAKEQAVKRETAEQLDTYRKQQAAAQKPDLSAMQADTPTSDDADAWVTKKRRRKELDNPISKLRKTSTTTAPAPEVTTRTQKAETKRSDSASSSHPSTVTKPATFSGSSLGLGAYSSDED